MPSPNNYLSKTEDKFAVNQLQNSCGGSCKTSACPDARFARLINGKISEIPDAKGILDIKNRDPILYSRNGAVVASKDKLQNVIVLILESPHIDEFAGKIIAPAMGRTGEHCFRYFDKLFGKSRLASHISKRKQYDLVFVNSVQYQTSCGASPLTNKVNKQRRDVNWMAIFNGGSSEDLLKRLAALNPVLVLNLCTKSTMGLQAAVEATVKSKYPQNYTTGDHPFNWFKPSAKIN